MRSPRLSVCLIAKNEEKNLPRALESVREIAHEVVVVDTGSTDSSIAIARSYGARVVEHPWRENFAEARNVALDHASGDWVLMLDADEEVTQSMALDLPGLMSDPKADAYFTILINQHHGGRVTQRIPVLRLFRNRREYRYRYRIHEQILDNILQAGGHVKRAYVEVFHYGYSAEEDRRKSRRDRNIRLLELEMKAEPSRTELYYYLGIEYIQEFRIAEAEKCFRKKLEQEILDDPGILSAVVLSEILLRRHQPAEAWVVASRGLGSFVAHQDALIRIAQAARAEGDYLVVADCAAQLRQVPQEAPGQISRTPGLIVDLEASALWEEGRRAEALRAWRTGVENHPEDLRLADHWIRNQVRAEGIRTAVGAVRERRHPAVASAVIGALLREGELSLAASLSESIGDFKVPSPYLLHGLARAGRWKDAQDIADQLAVEGMLHLAVASIWLNNQEILERTLKQIPDLWRLPLERLLQGQTVGHQLQPGLQSWMEYWADLGFHQLFRIGLGSLEGSQSQRTAWAALRLYSADRLHLSLGLANEYPGEPDAMEVLGLDAYERSDWESVARYLPQRAEAGPAPVRVYLRGALALDRIGQHDKAQRLLEIGRRARPMSRVLSDGQVLH